MYFLNQIKENYIFIYENLSIPLIISCLILFYFYLKQISFILKSEDNLKYNNIYFSFIPFIGQFYLGFKQRKIFFNSRKQKKINLRELILLNNLNNVFLISLLMFLLGFYIAGVIFIFSLFLLYFKINQIYYKKTIEE